MADKELQTVLVVDDTEANIDILVEILGEFYDISVAMDGPSAIETAEELQPAIILLDIMMPDMDGYEVLKRLKAGNLTQHIPVVFVTAKGEIDDKLDGYDLGASGYVTKPVDPALVVDTIEKVLSEQ